MHAGADPGVGRSSPLKPTKVKIFTMILNNSERPLIANWILTAKYFWNRPPKHQNGPAPKENLTQVLTELAVKVFYTF